MGVRLGISAQGDFFFPKGPSDYLNYLNLYHVNSIGITYIIKSKVKFTFSNKARKEDRQGGRKTSCWRPEQLESNGK